jgi:hypothetical protein
LQITKKREALPILDFRVIITKKAVLVHVVFKNNNCDGLFSFGSCFITLYTKGKCFFGGTPCPFLAVKLRKIPALHNKFSLSKN